MLSIDVERKIRLLSIKSLCVYMMACARMNNKRFFCNALSGKSAYSISINCDLSVSCNCRDYDGSGHIGDLSKQNLTEILSGEIANKFRKVLAKGRLPILTCARCSELRWVEVSEAEYFVNNYSVPTKGIMIENTIACDLECLSCARSLVMSNRKKHKMSLVDIKKVSEMVHDYGIRSVSFFNLGEPFISKDIKAELEILRGYNPDTTIMSSTNGQVLASTSKRQAAMLLDYITFSIDGSTQESISRYQRGISFDKAYSNLVEVVKCRNQMNRRIPVVEWKYVLFNWNDSNYLITRAIELAKQAGVDIISFWPTLSPFHGISMRYYCGNYFKSIGKPSWKGREIDFRI